MFKNCISHVINRSFKWQLFSAKLFKQNFNLMKKYSSMFFNSFFFFVHLYHLYEHWFMISFFFFPINWVLCKLNFIRFQINWLRSKKEEAHRFFFCCALWKFIIIIFRLVTLYLKYIQFSFVCGKNNFINMCQKCNYDYNLSE